MMIDRMLQLSAHNYNLRLAPILTLICLLTSTLLFSCSGNEGELSKKQEKLFVQTYVELLIIREQYPDTSDANPRVRALMEQQGYSEALFKQQFNTLAQDTEKFRATIDSARSRARSILRGKEPTDGPAIQDSSERPTSD